MKKSCGTDANGHAVNPANHLYLAAWDKERVDNLIIALRFGLQQHNTHEICFMDYYHDKTEVAYKKFLDEYREPDGETHIMIGEEQTNIAIRLVLSFVILVDPKSRTEVSPGEIWAKLEWDRVNQDQSEFCDGIWDELKLWKYVHDYTGNYENDPLLQMVKEMKKAEKVKKPE